MKTNSKAKFFCENCGAEVPENAKVCKTCGKFFISVRCPKCGATGNHSDFENGCPECGYAVNGSHFSTNNKFKKNGKLINKSSRKKTYSYNSKLESSLPCWVYIFTAVVFFIVLFMVYSCIKA